MKTKSTSDSESEKIKKAVVRYSILIFVPMNAYLLSLFTWDWGKTTKFHLAHEGWFGRNTYVGGADKAAHFFTFYAGMRIFYNIFDYTEEGRNVKWAYAALLTAFLALGIEIGDGFCSNQNGFGVADLTMDLLGIGIASMLELFPVVDGFISFSIRYFPTKYFLKHPQRLKWFMDDYSGWKFMANIKLAGFRIVGVKVPDFVRYIQFDIGYQTRGYTRFDYKYGEWERTLRVSSRKREIFIGISVNLSEVIRDFFTEKDSFTSRALQQPFKYYHVPVGGSLQFKL